GYKKILKALLIDRISGLFAIMFLIGVIIFISSFRQFIWLTGLLIVIAPFGLYLLHKILFLEFNFYPFLYSVIIQLLQGFSFLAILISLGLKSHLSDFLILFYISSIISVIPVSVGGIGLRELTFLYGLEYLHLNPTVGIVAAFLFFVISLISSVIGILFLKGVENV
ncbi:MAG: lysylphosphatidylglycerol synthase domain-containing protein, partial [Nautiliaceae bacterium]